jgi:hypothetical protein
MSWMKLGAVPMATLKFQNRSSADNTVVGDSWHHMTIYNVLPSGIVIGDALSIVGELELENQLTTAEPTVLVPRADIVSRWHDSCNLGVLAMNCDARWRGLNVLGQVINILRESQLPPCSGCRPQMTSHLKLPTHYHSGITLFAVAHSAAFAKLQVESLDLPHLSTDDTRMDCPDSRTLAATAVVQSMEKNSLSKPSCKLSSAV